MKIARAIVLPTLCLGGVYGRVRCRLMVWPRRVEDGPWPPVCFLAAVGLFVGHLA